MKIAATIFHEFGMEDAQKKIPEKFFGFWISGMEVAVSQIEYRPPEEVYQDEYRTTEDRERRQIEYTPPKGWGHIDYTPRNEGRF